MRVLTSLEEIIIIIIIIRQSDLHDYLSYFVCFINSLRQGFKLKTSHQSMFVGLMYVTSILCNKKQTFVFSKRDGKDLWKNNQKSLTGCPGRPSFPGRPGSPLAPWPKQKSWHSSHSTNCLIVQDLRKEKFSST